MLVGRKVCRLACTGPEKGRGGMSNDYDGPVREYIRYCRKATAELTLKGSSLDPRYHPTEAGACKMIPHDGSPAEAKKIREAFREATEGPS